jgi:ribonucleoside-diphosphate reductase alpha chain
MNKLSSYSSLYIQQLNKIIIKYFPYLCPIQKNFSLSLKGISRLVMLDRYSQKDKELKTLQVGDVVLTTIKPDPRFPSKGIGKIVDKFTNEQGVLF